MLKKKSQDVNYNNIKFLYRKSKKLLSKKPDGLSRNDITNSIIGADWEKYGVVYRLLGNVFKEYDNFKHEKRKYILKSN
ncbi:hypothetical protein D4Q76_03090 [archaeon]|nr:MAG: hypothetical protein D4Q76_03090 [archaeon]